MTGFDASAVDVNRCERALCAAARRCGCAARGLRPRIFLGRWDAPNGRGGYYELCVMPDGARRWMPAGRRAGRPKVSKAKRRTVYERDGYRCRRCGCADPAHLEVDHVVPIARGGSNDLANLQTLCGRCNRTKSYAEVE